MQVGQKAGERAVLCVEELVIAGVERPVRSQEAIVADDRVHTADLEVHPPLGEDRQVGREVQVAEVLSEMGVAGREADAPLCRAQGGVGAGEIPHHEAKIEFVLLERFLNHPANFVEQELVAEPVQTWLHGENSRTRRCPE